jgi:outer membrane lipoprotein LolB
LSFKHGRLLALALAGLLAACAQLPLPGFAPPPAILAMPAPLSTFLLEGRVSVKANEESFSGGMSWRHAAEQQELLLRTPLGQGVAELRGDSAGVELRDSEGHLHRAADAETLVHQALGVTLPLKGLAWWVVGSVRPGAPYRMEPDGEGRPGVLHQDGWRIEFSRYAQVGGHFLPGKLVARRADDLEIRLVVDSWDLNWEPGRERP